MVRGYLLPMFYIFKHLSKRINYFFLAPDFNTELPEGQLVTVSGFGHVDFDTQEKATSLQFVSKPIVSPETCDRLHSDPTTEDMICAGFAEGGADACIGDSGGPLVLIPEKTSADDNSSSSESVVLVGVVSWGVKCADIYPGVYSKVSHSRDWVDEAVREGWNGRKRRSLRRKSNDATHTDRDNLGAVNIDDEEKDERDTKTRGSAGNRVTEFDWAKCSSYLTKRAARVDNSVSQTMMTPTSIPVESSTSSSTTWLLQTWIQSCLMSAYMCYYVS